MTDYQCQPCQQTFKTKSAYTKHLNSQKHQKKPIISHPILVQEEKVDAVVEEEGSSTTLLDTTPRLRYLFHISDIHIPCDKRHAEYRQVFQRFLTILDQHPSTKESAVIITGDLLDHKNRITPEEIVLAREFILDLAHRCPVFLIAGNHDKNLSFPLKEDNITAIISNGRFPHKRVHYLKHSVCYRYGNVTFGVSSVLDGKIVKEVPENEYKVALYHGGVGKYTLYNNTTSKENTLSLSSFEKYDVVLLGDIHKWQFLDSQQRIAYAGSMLQKNHGETWSDHGYLFWELEKKTATHHHIENEYRFVTLNITDGKRMTPLEGLPKHLYVRWELKETGSNVLSPFGVQGEVRKKFVVEEETYQHSTFFVEKPYAEGPRTIFDLGTSKQFEYMLSWIDHEKKRDFVGDDVDQLEALNLHYNEQMQELVIPAVHWKLIDLQFENIFCYQERQSISFLNMKGVNGIVAPNHAGKSAIFDILLFTLYGCSTRSDMFSYTDLVHVPMDQSPSDRLVCSLRLQTIEKGEIYQIERSCSKEKSTMNVKIVKNDMVIYNGSSRDANATIIKLVGTYDDFLTTTVLAQKSEHNFLALHGKTQKEFTSRMFCLDLYEKLHKHVKREIKMAETEVAVLEQSYQTHLQDNPGEKNSQYTSEQIDLFLQEGELEDKIREREKERETLWTTFKPLLQNEPAESVSELREKKIIVTNERFDLKKKKETESYPYENEERAKAEKIELERDRHQIQEIPTQPFAKQLESLWLQIQKARNMLRTSRGEKPMLIKTDSLTLMIEKHQERYERMLEDQKATDLWLSENPLPETNVSINVITELREKREQMMKTMPTINTLLSITGVAEKVADKKKYLNQSRLLLDLPEETELVKYQGTLKTLQVEKKEGELLPKDARTEMEKKQEERRIKLVYLKKEEKKTLEIEEKLKQHRYNPECTFCCENPFVMTARKTLATLPSIQEQITQLEIERVEMEEMMLVQKYLVNLDFFLETVKKEIREAEKDVSLLEDSLQKYAENEMKLLERKEKETQVNIWKEEIEKIDRKKQQEDTLHKNHATLLQLKEEWIFFEKEMMSLIQQWKEADEKNMKQGERRIRLYSKLQQCNEYLAMCKLESELEKKELELEEKLTIKLTNQEAKKHNDTIQERVQRIFNEVQKLQKEHTLLVKKIAELDVLLKTTSEKMEAMEGTKKKYARRKRELDLLNLYATMTHHNGIPAFLLRKISHLLEETTNQILSQYSDMRVKIHDESKETIIRVKSPKKATYLNAKLLCGSESFLIELAFRVAFQLLSNVSKPNFIICDEGWACLDETARSKLRDILGALLEHNEYLLTVSHIQDVKAWMTQSISIEIDETGKHWIKQT